MEIIKITLTSLYLIITIHFLTNWLRFFNKNSTLSVEDRFLSVLILCIVTFLWPFMIPVSCLTKLGQVNSCHCSSCKQRLLTDKQTQVIKYCFHSELAGNLELRDQSETETSF